MANIYGELKRAQLESSAADPTAAIVGLINYQTTDHKVKFATGAIATALLANDQYCVFGTAAAANNIRLNRAAAGVLQFVLGNDVTAEGALSVALAQLSFKVESYATGALPAAGVEGRLLWDSTYKRLKVDTGTVLSALGVGGNAGQIQWSFGNYLGNDPESSSVSNIEVWDFNSLDLNQAVPGAFTLPSTYLPGTQVTLEGASFATTSIAGRVLFQAVAYLIRSGTTVLGTHPNSHTSTNAEVVVSAVASQITDVGSIDLSTNVGTINGVALAPGDKIIFTIGRVAATINADADARLLWQYIYPKYSI